MQEVLGQFCQGVEESFKFVCYIQAAYLEKKFYFYHCWRIDWVLQQQYNLKYKIIMGNVELQHKLSPGIHEYITQQYCRLKHIDLSPSQSYSQQHQPYSSSAPDTTLTYNSPPLTLCQLIQTRHPKDYPFTFKHLAVLYLCDYDKDGLFSIKDIQMFAIWIQINMSAIQMYQFQSQLQAKTVALLVMQLRNDVVNDNNNNNNNRRGQQQIVAWFMRMLISSHKTTTIKSTAYISIDSIKTIYQIFNVQVLADMDIQQFFYLVKKSSQELGYQIQEVMNMNIGMSTGINMNMNMNEQQQQQEYVCIKICQEFVKGFIKGVNKILKDVGYQQGGVVV